MTCKRCAADPQPITFASPRACAFDEEGNFTPDNWSCATIDELLWRLAISAEGDDETLQVITHRTDEGTDGFVVLTRYKYRGKTSSAVLAGDFWPPKPLTLSVAEGICERVPRAVPEARETEWLPECNDNWRLIDPSPMRLCRMPRCTNVAVAAFSRPTKKGPRTESYCGGHLYGRRIHDGVIEGEFVIGSQAHAKAKAKAEGR